MADATANPSIAENNEIASGETLAPLPENAGNQAPASPGETPASPPDAPADTPQDDRAALLEVVQPVVSKAPPAKDAKTPPQGEAPAEQTGEQAPEAAPEADPTDDELKALAPRTKRRIEVLLKQRGEARTEAEALKPAAAKWQQMDGYLQTHNLAPADVNLLLGVGAALRRGDFKAFRDGIQPYIELANQHLGLTLPGDLQTMVEQGEITQDAATELSVARLNNLRHEGQAKERADANAAANQRAEQERVAATVNAAVTDWEAETRQRDPDYDRKAPTILRVSQALIAEHGRPASPAAAVLLARQAYDETNRMFRTVAPAPVPTRPVPVGVRGVNNARPEPRNLMEAALQGLERARARA